MEIENIKYELFEIKQKFLREIPHPKLILKQIKQLEIKGSLKERLTDEIGKVELNEEEVQTQLKVFLEQHMNASLKLKQRVSIATSYQELCGALTQLYKGQLVFLKKLQSYLAKQKDYPDKSIKMSQAIDSYQILKSIRELKLEENEIKAYLCKELNENVQAFTVLTEACLRANKIIRHG